MGDNSNDSKPDLLSHLKTNIHTLARAFNLDSHTLLSLHDDGGDAWDRASDAE